MEFAGTLLQLVGAFVIAWGLFIAWDRAADVVDQWRQSLAGLREQIARRRDAVVDVEVIPNIDAETRLIRQGTPEKRLEDVENEISQLPGKTKKQIDAAMDERLARIESETKALDVKEIIPALIGIGIGFVGTLLQLIAQISC